MSFCILEICLQTNEATVDVKTSMANIKDLSCKQFTKDNIEHYRVNQKSSNTRNISSSSYTTM
jgi:hypothetical protein